MGGGYIKDQKPKKGLKKEFKTGCIKLPMQLCCKCGSVLCILPCQIIKWVQFKDSKWSRHKIETFRGAKKRAEKEKGPQFKYCVWKRHLRLISGGVELNLTMYMFWSFFIGDNQTSCFQFYTPLVFSFRC